jgi:hypothetical protein
MLLFRVCDDVCHVHARARGAGKDVKKCAGKGCEEMRGKIGCKTHPSLAPRALPFDAPSIEFEEIKNLVY